MKPTWLISAGVTALLAVSSSAMPAPGRSGDRDDRELHTKFDNRDRQAARKWYNEHSENLPKGFRDADRLNPEEESRLQVGVALEPEARKKVRPAPVDLLRRLPPPPRHYRYAILDEHLLLVEDRTWNISDIIHLHVGEGHSG